MGGLTNIETRADRTDSVGPRCDAKGQRTLRRRYNSLPDPNRELRWIALTAAMTVTVVLVFLPFLLIYGVRR